MPQTVVGGVLTNYYETNPGGKKILLILHGWRQSGGHWQNIANSLPDNIRVVALDLPAFGSTQPLSGEPSVAEYVDFVHGFIVKLKLKKVILLGHSFGGQVAVDLALRFPQDIEKLILVSPACIRSSRLNLKSRIVKIFGAKLPQEIRKYLLKFIASSDYQKSNPTQRSVLNRILRVDYTNKLKDIKANTYIIWGTKDTTIPNSSKLLATQIPHSTLIPLYDVDHNPHLTATDKLLIVLKRCLDF